MGTPPKVGWEVVHVWDLPEVRCRKVSGNPILSQPSHRGALKSRGEGCGCGHCVCVWGGCLHTPLL